MEDPTMELVSLQRDIRLSQQEILREVVENQRERIRTLERQILELRRILQYRVSHSVTGTASN